MTFISMICPTLECIWDPHTQTNIHSIEMMQKCDARLVTSNYEWNSSVTAMLEDLQWSTLSHRRTISRLSITSLMISQP